MRFLAIVFTVLSINANAVTAKVSLKRETETRLRAINTENATTQESACINKQIAELNNVNWESLASLHTKILIPLRSYTGKSGQDYSYSNNANITVSYGTASIVTDIVLTATGTCKVSTAATIASEIVAARKRDAQ